MKNNNKGFSLVELIVVIAIMAILAAVAVVGVSVYIPKAQQASDKQLIADIEDILLYEGYAGTFEEGEGGYIILSPEGDAVVKGEALIEALTNAYGANYTKELKLAYDKWSNNGLQAGVSAEMAYLVANSNYLTGDRADDLLADVEKMTSVVNRINEIAADSNVTTSISGMFTKGEGESAVCTIDATAAKYGISKGEYETWDLWAAASTENQATFSNLLVLTAADESAAVAAGTMSEDDMSEASKLVLEFSSYYAFASQNSGFSSEFQTMMDNLNNVESFGQGSSWFDTLRDKAEDYGYTSDYKGADGDYDTDKLAFTAIMSNVSNATNAQPDAIKGSLSNTDFFTQGVVNDLYNDYLTNVDAMAGFYDPDAQTQVDLDLQAGEVAILFAQKDGVTTVTSSLPN